MQDLRELVHWCKRCGNTSLLLLPGVFERRQKNTTWLDREATTVFWKVRLVFPHANAAATETKNEGTVVELDGYVLRARLRRSSISLSWPVGPATQLAVEGENKDFPL